MNHALLTCSPPQARVAWNLWLANLVLAGIVSSALFAHLAPLLPASGELDFELWLGAISAWLASLATTTAVLGVPLVLAARRVTRVRRFAWIQAGAWTLFQGLLFADTRVYNLFQYHLLSSQVFDLLVTRGAEDSVHLGWPVYALVGGGALLGLALEYALWSYLSRPSLLPRCPHLALPRAGWVFGVLLAPAVVLDKSLHAGAGEAREQRAVALRELFPFTPRTPLSNLSSSLFGESRAPRHPVARIAFERCELDYPLRAPIIAARAARPNVLVLVADCLRRDMLGPRCMPELAARAGQFRRFDDHLSGGNSTRFGLFSLFYGLHGNYWLPVHEERRAPVLLDALQAQGYAVHVASSATLNYPELRQTVFANIPEADLRDEWPASEPWQRDELAAAELCEWIAAQQRSAPFFGFLFLDSTHQPYSSPPTAQPFQPAAAELNYVALSSLDRGDQEDRALLESIQNRYFNATHHVDRVLARVLDCLDQLDLARETLVLITGDHGEEFWENGFFGHTSNFTAEQVAVPLLLRGPGVEAGVEKRPTAHVDVPATLLEALGASPEQRASWTLGRNLLEPTSARRRVVAGWQRLGLWTEEGIVCLPLHEGRHFEPVVRDFAWQLTADPQAALARQEHALAQLAFECTRFVRAVPAPPLAASARDAAQAMR